MKKNLAFTLAEVLITLAIIGVVAALTIPTVVTNYKKKTYVTQLKKTYNYLTRQKGINFEIEFLHIKEDITPKFRIISEAQIKQNKAQINNKYQYIIFSGEPYENIAVKIPNISIDYNPKTFISYWDENRKIFYLNFMFKLKNLEMNKINNNE